MAEPKELTLSDGKVVAIRRPKARDVDEAMRIAGGEGSSRMKFSCALIALIATFDGKQMVMEDVLELYASDVDLIATAAGGDFLSSSAPLSQSSSNGDSRSLN